MRLSVLLNPATAPAVTIFCSVCSWPFFMRPSSLGGGRILRRTLSVRLSLRLSVRPVMSVTSGHLANYNGTHVLFGRAAYRTAISAAQILVEL